ncbi:OmpA family protein [Aliarcobacter cibarius]|jgi:outer membrane protein OmpA-like peptidoglycan-associated protein|uniref:Glycine zipper 2TM domain-containing protein n=1 Tax=Aliarcobacter cibarius TaxID=255507 RepID=A0ABY2V5M5_9BACT|nr:OmpA family protein [Aliarcobacter cibarius]QEZ89848.1 OmpA domain-containing protein [Aliarcobacter cibarius]TLT00831.1 glycine zipper 2TM domain-containing protein [Aliarcobacter cibarius]TLT01401.1 glycine zipper 2TM domain-containing protein [Aliarcobacter cibarius]
MRVFNLKVILTSAIAVSMLTGCASSMNTGNQTFDNNQNAIIGTTVGAIAGVVLGNNIGGGSKSRNKVIGGLAGAAIGGAVGYSLDKQAKEVAQSLNTDVNNNPNAQMDPNQDLIVSNTDKYVKIMFRDDMMFEVNSANPTYSASQKISKLNTVLKNYPNTLVQVVGHTDNSGKHAYNQKLSEQRASNVGNIIYSNGVPNQIFSRGCSFDKPIVANSSKENMALNRRVEVYLYPNQESVIDVCK